MSSPPRKRKQASRSSAAGENSGNASARATSARFRSDSKVPCRFFGTESGCRYGDRCRFVHQSQSDKTSIRHRHVRSTRKSRNSGRSEQRRRAPVRSALKSLLREEEQEEEERAAQPACDGAAGSNGNMSQLQPSDSKTMLAARRRVPARRGWPVPVYTQPLHLVTDRLRSQGILAGISPCAVRISTAEQVLTRLDRKAHISLLSGSGNGMMMADPGSGLVAYGGRATGEGMLCKVDFKTNRISAQHCSHILGELALIAPGDFWPAHMSESGHNVLWSAAVYVPGRGTVVNLRQLGRVPLSPSGNSLLWESTPVPADCVSLTRARHHGGTTLLCHASERLLSVFDVASTTARPEPIVAIRERFVSSAAWMSDCASLMYSTKERLCFADTREGRRSQSRPCHQLGYARIQNALPLDGGRYAVLSGMPAGPQPAFQSIRLFDVRMLHMPVLAYDDYRNDYVCLRLAMSRDGRFIFAPESDGGIAIYNTWSEKVLQRYSTDVFPRGGPHDRPRVACVGDTTWQDMQLCPTFIAADVDLEVFGHYSLKEFKT